MRSTHLGTGPHDDPSAEQMRAWQLRTSAPENEIPVGLPCNFLIGRTDDVAVAVVGVRAYTTGISFDLAVRLRRIPAGLGQHDLHELIGGFHRQVADLSRQLLVGIEYADGRRASTVGGPAWPPAQVDDQQPVLMPSSGGGGGRIYDQSYWLSPVPSADPVTFVCSWPAMGIPETRVVIGQDAYHPYASFGAASEGALVLWPWEPEREQPEPDPILPTDGWFGDAARGLGKR